MSLLASAGALALGLGAPCAQADDHPSPGPDAGGDVVVTATRSARALADVPESVSVVTAADIAGTPARTVDDVLRRTAGVDLPLVSTNEQHPTDTIVSMRGLGGLRALVLLDGLPINDPFFGYVQWSEAPLQTVSRIEVVRGGGATLWGNYAMGGVIDILTRPPTRSGLTAEAAGGSRGTYRVDGRAAYGGPGASVAVDGGASGSDGYVEQATGYRGAATVPTAFAARTAALSGDAALTPALTARGRVSVYDNDETFLTRLNTNHQRDWRLTGALAWRPTENVAVDLAAFHVDERFRTDNPGTPDGADPLDVEYVQNRHLTRADQWGASLTASRTFAGGWLRQLQGGLDGQWVGGRDDARIFDSSGAYLRTDTGAGEQRFLGAFLQADVRPIEALQVLASVRYQDFLNYGGRDGAPGGLGPDVPSRHDGVADPRVSVRWTLGAGWSVRGAWYRAFRAPTLDNLYRAASVPGYILYGNPALAPETLEGGEAGVDYVRGPLRVQVTGYTSRISGFLTYRYLPADQLPAGFDVGARLINAGEARSRGAEAELTWRPSSALAVTAAYTFADSIVTRNPEDPAGVGVQQPGVPRHRLSAGVDWTGPFGITVSPRARYVGRTVGDPDAVFHTGAHFVADLALSAPLGGGLSAFLQLENLLDRRYVGVNDGFTAPLLGRPFTATAGLRLTLR